MRTESGAGGLRGDGVGDDGLRVGWGDGFDGHAVGEAEAVDSDGVAAMWGLGGEEDFDGSGGGAEVVAGLAALIDEIVGDDFFDAAVELALGFDGVAGRGGAEAVGYGGRELAGGRRLGRLL